MGKLSILCVLGALTALTDVPTATENATGAAVSTSVADAEKVTEKTSPTSAVPPFRAKLRPMAEYFGGLLFPGSDFETGSLDGWRLENSAFERQPTQGDNVAARHPEYRALPAGEFFIGTYERFQGQPGEKPGTTQGDRMTGGLISPTFVIEQPYITFLIGGGYSSETGVRLIVGGTVVLRASGANREEMGRQFWDVREHVGEQAQLYFVDRETGPWGHLNVDDFRYATAIPNTLLFPNSDFEAGNLENWQGKGDAFAWQPTKGDTVSLRHHGESAGVQGAYWINSYDKYQGREGQTPGDTVGNEATGSLRSIPFEIVGDLITFKIAGGRGKEVGVHLMVKGEKKRTTRGGNQPELSNAAWYVPELKGEVAEILIEDQATGSWGAISADDFRYGRF